MGGEWLEWAIYSFQKIEREWAREDAWRKIEAEFEAQGG